jgi:hypothetical protein
MLYLINHPPITNKAHWEKGEVPKEKILPIAAKKSQEGGSKGAR